MWHASIMRSPLDPPIHGRPAGHPLHVVAQRLLSGVGDAAAGEWLEAGEQVIHLRRRLTTQEAERWAPELRDVRGTSEARERVARLPKHTLHLVPPEVLRLEMNGELSEQT